MRGEDRAVYYFRDADSVFHKFVDCPVDLPEFRGFVDVAHGGLEQKKLKVRYTPLLTYGQNGTPAKWQQWAPSRDYCSV